MVQFRPQRDKVGESRRSAGLLCGGPLAARGQGMRLKLVNLKKKPYFSGNDLCLTGPD
jgi:hypothetical protein